MKDKNLLKIIEIMRNQLLFSHATKREQEVIIDKLVLLLKAYEVYLKIYNEISTI